MVLSTLPSCVSHLHGQHEDVVIRLLSVDVYTISPSYIERLTAGINHGPLETVLGKFGVDHHAPKIRDGDRHLILGC